MTFLRVCNVDVHIVYIRRMDCLRPHIEYIRITYISKHFQRKYFLYTCSRGSYDSFR